MRSTIAPSDALDGSEQTASTNFDGSISLIPEVARTCPSAPDPQRAAVCLSCLVAKAAGRQPRRPRHAGSERPPMPPRLILREVVVRVLRAKHYQNEFAVRRVRTHALSGTWRPVRLRLRPVRGLQMGGRCSSTTPRTTHCKVALCGSCPEQQRVTLKWAGEGRGSGIGHIPSP